MFIVEWLFWLLALGLVAGLVGAVWLGLFHWYLHIRETYARRRY